MNLHRAHMAILGITALNFVIMVVYATPKLLAAADGMVQFDVRFMGYTLETATLYVNTISEEGRLFYLNTQIMLDTFFPALLAISLMLTLFRLAPKLPVLFMFPISGALFDYYENASIAQILLSAAPDKGLVEMASLLTGLKFASVATSLLAIMLLLYKSKRHA